MSFGAACGIVVVLCLIRARQKRRERSVAHVPVLLWEPTGGI